MPSSTAPRPYAGRPAPIQAATTRSPASRTRTATAGSCRSSPLEHRSPGRLRPDAHPFTGTGEDAQDLGRLLARAAEPVRHLGAELGDLAWPEHPVLVAEHDPHPAGQHVDPL